MDHEEAPDVSEDGRGTSGALEGLWNQPWRGARGGEEGGQSLLLRKRGWRWLVRGEGAPKEGEKVEIKAGLRSRISTNAATLIARSRCRELG